MLVAPAEIDIRGDRLLARLERLLAGTLTTPTLDAGPARARRVYVKDLQRSPEKNPRRRALQSDCGAQRLFESARLELRILGVLRGTGACSSALPHTPTHRELFCRRIVGPEMARIGFERNAALEERVFTIAFLSLMDGLKPIHSRRERRVH